MYHNTKHTVKIVSFFLPSLSSTTFVSHKKQQLLLLPLLLLFYIFYLSALDILLHWVNLFFFHTTRSYMNKMANIFVIFFNDLLKHDYESRVLDETKK